MRAAARLVVVVMALGCGCDDRALPAPVDGGLRAYRECKWDPVTAAFTMDCVCCAEGRCRPCADGGR